MKTLATAALILIAAAPVVASGEDDPTSLSYISYLERYATIQPASNEESIEAVTNTPLVIGDRVDTAREARMEIILADGSILWLDQYTTASLDAVAYSRDVGSDRTVLYLVDGKIMIQVPEHVLTTEPLRIDSSGATAYLNQPGIYRIEVLFAGGLRVEVWEGLAEAATTAGGVLVQPSTAAEIRDGSVTGVEPNLTWGDDFARWVEQRRLSYESESSQYVDERYARESAILDNYGTWVYIDASQSWAWQPAVSADWRPYTAGRWYWTSTGWSWVSYEPWGWLPYHYGSWNYTAGYGWVWGWGSVWSPAWVSWCWWPGYVSWCPWGYYNSWCWGRYPGWGWGHYPSHPSYPGGGHNRPPRGNVVPPRDGVNPGDAGRRQTPEQNLRAGAESTGAGRRVTPSDGNLTASSGRRAAADFTGHTRVGEMDRSGWNVVATEDFASEHLSRVVRPGSRAMQDSSDAVGVVVTGPLTTRSPARADAGDEIARTFADVGARTDRDITRVMARDTSLQREDIDRLVEPISLTRLGRSSAQSVVESQREATVPARSNAGGGDGYTVSNQSSLDSPQPSRTSFARGTATNLYRPGRYVSSGGGSGSGSVTSTSRTLVDPSSMSRSAGGSRTTTTGGTSASSRSYPSGRASSTMPSTRNSVSQPSTRNTTLLPRTRSSSSLPSTRPSTSPLVRQPVSPRVGGGRPSSTMGSSRPVIVPRTTSSRSGRSMGSGSPSAPSSSYRSSPSGRSSSSSARAPSRSSSGSSAGRSSGSARSSGGSSSGSRSSASSGGSKTRRH